MNDADLLDNYPDDLLMDGGDDDMLDDILNSLIELDGKGEGPLLNPSSKSSNARRSGNSSSAGNKKRKFNPDAEKIAEVTEAALRSLEIDPNSQDAKKKRRQIRNRLSAQFHRDRKNAYIKELEEKNSLNLTLIDSLQKRIQELETENIRLKEQATLYHSTLRSGSTASGSDSESSSSGSSPIHQPNYFNPPTSSTALSVSSGGLNSLREIVPNRNSSAIPLPVAKTLSLLSVLCILCMTYLEHPLNFNSNTMDSNSMSNFSPRRRLEAPQSLDRAFFYPVLNESMSSSSSSPMIQNSSAYLRGSQPSVNASHPTVVFVSKDLIPFDLPNQYQRDWYSRPDVFDGMSYSHIVMNSGVALFDPSMKFHRHHESLDQSHLAVVPTATHHHYKGYPRLGFEEKPVVMEINESKDEEDEALIEEKHWPAVTSHGLHPHSQSFISQRVQSLEPPRVMDCSHCSQDDTALLGKLLEQSNLVTVTVPASSVRMGKTVQDSEDGTMEGIMEMFNLTNEYGERNATTTSTVQQNSLADASVEINCIILSAKLIMNAPKH